MLSRSFRSSARRYSTQAATDIAGVKVAARDAQSPVSRVSVVVNAGSRHGQAGVAHLLKNFALHTSTSTSSGLRRWREAELIGGYYSAELDRENIVLNAQFLRAGLPHFVTQLGDVINNQIYKQHEFSEQVLPQSVTEAKQFDSSSVNVAIEKAHEVAFRKGLGTPLHVQDYAPVTLQQVSNYGKEAFTKSNIQIVATGVDTKDFSDLVEKNFKKVHTGEVLTSEKTKFYGGETRTASAAGNSVVLAFPTSPSNTNTLITSLLGGQTNVKWSAGQSPLSVASIKTGTTIKAEVKKYSDAHLLYVSVDGATAADVTVGVKEAVRCIKELATKVTDQQVAQATAQAKFTEAARSDSSFLYSLKAQTESFGDVASVKQAVGGLTSGPVVLSVVGNVQQLPYLDELL